MDRYITFWPKSSFQKKHRFTNLILQLTKKMQLRSHTLIKDKNLLKDSHSWAIIPAVWNSLNPCHTFIICICSQNKLLLSIYCWCADREAILKIEYQYKHLLISKMLQFNSTPIHLICSGSTLNLLKVD